MGKTAHFNLNKPEGTDQPDIALLNENMDTLDSEVFTRAKSWNGIQADATGNITAQTIPFAENLSSTRRQVSEEEFIVRTAGGSASLGGGLGILERIYGNSTHTGYSAAEIELSVVLATRSDIDERIDVTISEETFLSHAPSVSTVTLIYTTQWTADPAPPAGATPLTYYGLTVSGTPRNGDNIIIEYTAENPGTITQSNPTALTATGWNLYNHNAGYARVVKYSTSYGFKITGAYDTLRFSTTIDGTRSTVSPDADGNFSVTSDGYVWVTGGNNTNTAIWATWSDWTDSYDGEFDIYREYSVNFGDYMTTNFPYGLMRVGDIRDELNFSTGQGMSRIERLENDSEGVNLARAKASGLAYDYDTDYVYVEKGSYDAIGGLPVTNTFTSNDHGIEYIGSTTVPVTVRTTYSTDLRNKLERDVLTISSQSLSEAEKAQVRANIGAAAPGDGGGGGSSPSPSPGITGPLFTWDMVVYRNLSISGYSSSTVKYQDVANNIVPGYRGFGMMGYAVWTNAEGAGRFLTVSQAYYYPLNDGVRFVINNTSEWTILYDLYVYVQLVKEDLFVDYV